MMMGYGSYGHGGGYSSSSSNLSALAPPFTVDRPVSKPLVDLTEPPLNWLNTHSLNFDSTHSSNAYGYPFNPPSAAHIPSLESSIPVPSTDSFLFGLNSDTIPAAANLVEAKTYYPSYVSPSKYGYDDYIQSLSGLWDGSRNWEYGKKVEFGDSFCSKEMNVPDLSCEDYANQGAQSTKGLSACEQNSNSNDMLGGQKHLESASRVQIDYKSYPGHLSEFVPTELPIKSVLEQGCAGNHQPSYGTSYDTGVKQHSIRSSDMSSVTKSSFGFVLRSQAIGTGPSVPNTSSLNNVENGAGVNNTDFSGNNNLSNTKDFHPLQSSEAKVHFDSSQLSFHLEGDNHRFPDIGPVGFNLTLASNEAVNHFEGCSECLDHYNPAVDSPCWKGAPMCQFSPLEISGPVSSQLRKKMETGYGSNSIGPADNAVKFSPQKPSEYSLYQEEGCMEYDSASSPKPHSLPSLLFGEHRYDHDVKAGTYHTQSSCGLGVQFSDYMDKPRKDCVLSNNAVDEFNFKSFHSMQQNCVEDKLDFGRECESGTGVLDVGMNTNDASKGCSSHVPFHATEHRLSSPPIEAARCKLAKLHGEEELAPKICARTLISTMHNLSELLLFHFSNEVCELKENDLESLKNVVNNVDKCISKTLRPEAPSQENLLAGKCSQFHRELPELHEGMAVSRPQATKPEVSVLNQIPSDYQHVPEKSFHDIMSGKKGDKQSDITYRRDDTDRVKFDNTTQAIKKVLSENFVEDEDTQPQILLYKNLWLEAEAALCLVNYKARFDRMRIELERCNSFKAKDLSEDTTELEKSSWPTYSPDLNTTNKLPPKIKDDLTLDVSALDFPITNRNCHPADVMARFHILKCLGSNANCSSTTVRKLSSSNVSDDMNKVEKMASNAKNDQTPYISTCDSPKSSFTSHADDVEASIIARFDICKSRIENSNSANLEDQLSPQVADLGFAGKGKHWAEEGGVLEGNMEPVLQHDSGNDTPDELTMNEFHLRVKDDPMIETHETSRLGNQLPASCYDSSSSDWEHVLKEDLPGQNC